MSPIRLVFGALIALAVALPFARVFAPVLADTPPPAASPPNIADFECDKNWRELTERTQNGCEGWERSWCAERRQVIDEKCAGSKTNRKLHAATILKAAAAKDCARLWQNDLRPIAAKTGSCSGHEDRCRRAFSICADAEDRDAMNEIRRFMAGRPAEPKKEADVAKPPSPPPPPLSADAIAKCRPQLDRLIDAGLARDERAIQIYEQRFLAPNEKDCLRFLNGEALKASASLPPKSADGLYEFACKMSGERCAAAKREKEEAAACTQKIVNIVGLWQNRPTIEEQRKLEAFKGFDQEFAAAQREIRENARCREMCATDPECAKALAEVAAMPGAWPRVAFNDTACGRGMVEVWRFGRVPPCLAAFATALPRVEADPQAAPSGAANDPGFRRMCEQAQLNNATCEQRERQYRPDLKQDGERFGECRRLYASVLETCRQAGVATAAAPSARATTPPKATSPTVPSPQVATPAPTTPQPTMSAQCQQLVSNYVSAAKAKDGPRALAGYNALKRAGGCGVLQGVDRPQPRVAAPRPQVNDPRFVARGATPNSDAVVGACDASPAECAARVRQLQAGTSPEAKAALYMHAIGVGLELGTKVGAGMMMAVPPSAPRGSNMNSIGPGPVRNTYGPGSPQRPAPRTRQSDITGTK